MLAWSAPKAARRRMINSILQLPVSTIFCFRAKGKLKIKTGEEPKHMGFMAIAGEEFIFEMTANFLLLPRAGGVPTWKSNELGEREMMKLPRQFEQLLFDPVPLSEDIGESMAKWAAGGAVSRFEELVVRVRDADAGTLEKIRGDIEEAKKARAVNPSEYRALGTAFTARKKALPTPASGPSVAADDRGPMDDAEPAAS